MRITDNWGMVSHDVDSYIMNTRRKTFRYVSGGYIFQLIFEKKYSFIRINSNEERSYLSDCQAIKLLKLLFTNRGKIVLYNTVAKTLEINCYSDKYENIYFSEHVKYAKERLQNILAECGMPKPLIKSFVLTITKQGYMIP